MLSEYNKEYYSKGYNDGKLETRNKIMETIQSHIDEMFGSLKTETSEEKRRKLVGEIKGMDLAYKIAFFYGNDLNKYN